jgi:chromosome segregation ATPase
MKHEQPPFRHSRLAAARFWCPAGALLVSLLPAAAQDIRGMERCTAETKMERRTGCLQANVDFLQQALIKQARETQDRLAATDRDLAAARAEIAALKSAMEKLSSELTQMKATAEPAGKK